MNSMKRYIIALSLVVISLVVLVGYDGKEGNEGNEEGKQQRLESNQTELFYMYTDENGSYLLDANTHVENVIYVDEQSMIDWIGENYKSELEHGNRLVGTFDDEALWELVGLEWNGMNKVDNNK